MSEGASGDPSIAVVGTDALAVADTVTDAGGDVINEHTAEDAGAALDDAVGDVTGADVDLVVASGEAALQALARAAVEVPVLPVAAGDGVRSVPRDRLEEAVADLLADEWHTEHHPVLEVSVEGGASARALFDATLVSAEPARISEYRVAGDEPVAAFRADGVVVATPAGSAGYARDADAPVMPPETPALVVEPIAGFATAIDHWVLPQSPVEVVVERDETPVEVRADDRTLATVGPADPVTVAPVDGLDVVALAQGRSPFLAGARSRLEKL